MSSSSCGWEVAPDGHVRVSRAVAALVCALLAMSAGLVSRPAPARAATVHDYLSRLTGVPFGAPVSGSFSQPAGLAVDSVGDVYVGDSVSGVVDEFGPPSELSFLSQLLAPQVEGARAEAGGSVA